MSLGQAYVATQELLVNRPDPSVAGERETVDISPLLTAVNVVTLDVDPTAGNVATAFVIPDTGLVIAATLHVIDDFVGGTSVEIGANSDPDSLFTAANITTPTAGSLLGTGVDVTSIATGGNYDVTVTGTYTAGSATMKVLWMETRKTTDDPVEVGGSEQATLGLSDSLGDSSEAGTVS